MLKSKYSIIPGTKDILLSKVVARYNLDFHQLVDNIWLQTKAALIKSKFEIHYKLKTKQYLQ